MKLRSNLRPLSLALVLLAGAALPGRAHAQANLTFSGGLGAPLTLTLNAPVTYAVTSAGNGSGPLFVFQGVMLSSSPGAASGTLSFTINAGTPMSFSSLSRPGNLGSVTNADAFLYSSPGVTVSAVVLNAGTLTTTNNYAGAPPAGGSYATFITDTSFARLSANGVSVAPEPSTWTLLGAGAAGLGFVLRRRVRRA